MSLAEVRKQYADTLLKIEALGQSNDARKEAAKSARQELEAAALTNDSETVKTLMDDLKAMDQAYKEVKAEMDAAVSYLSNQASEIAAFYEQALNGGPKVDWKAQLIYDEEGLWDGWAGRWKPGNAMLLDAELCEPELRFVGELMGEGFRIELRPVKEAYHLRVQRPVYRGSCWSDQDGRWIVQRISGLLPGSALSEEVTQFLSELEVTGDQ